MVRAEFASVYLKIAPMTQISSAPEGHHHQRRRRRRLRPGNVCPQPEPPWAIKDRNSHYFLISTPFLIWIPHPAKGEVAETPTKPDTLPCLSLLGRVPDHAGAEIANENLDIFPNTTAAVWKCSVGRWKTLKETHKKTTKNFTVLPR